MSKTLEELGYEKEHGKSYTVYNKPIGEDGLLYKSITFWEKDKIVRIDTQIITMEELKAIYQYCIDNKWI